MKTSVLAAFAGALVLSFTGSPLAAPDPGLAIPVATRGGATAIVGLGLAAPKVPFIVEATTATSATYSNGIYRIRISEATKQFRSLIRVQVHRTDGEVFQLDGFSILVRIPRLNIAGIWYPSGNVSSTNVMVAGPNTPVRGRSDANYGIPYIAAATSNLKNVFAMGLGRQDASVSIEGTPVENGYYEFKLRVNTQYTASAIDERFYVSSDTTYDWFDKARLYADWVDALTDYRPFPASPRVYDPVYDTWYWSGDNVDENLYVNAAKLASGAGAKLFLADAGWDTLTGEYEKWLNGRTGDYNPPPDKFSDLSGTFNAIRGDARMGIQLWLQPFAVGRSSDRYPRTRSMHLHIPVGHGAMPGWFGLDYPPYALPASSATMETVNLCPRHDATQIYLRDLFNEMASEYAPEGYWLDFIDGISSTCVAPHAHAQATFGEGLRKSLETIKQAILANNPQPVVHFRAHYANLNNKPFSNVWQSEDSPGDFDRMRLNALRLRPFSKGVVFASDQLYWRDGESELTVSKFIMTSVMTGVPAFGVNLTEAPERTHSMIRAWLLFYQTYRQDLIEGRLSLFGGLNVPNHKIEGKTRTFAYLRDLSRNDITADSPNIFLMNATDRPSISVRLRGPAGVSAYSAQILNRYLAPGGPPSLVRTNRNGLINMNLAVEEGGMLILTPR